MESETSNRRGPIEIAKAKPSSLRAAVNAKCWECMGSGDEGTGTTRVHIRECTGTECPLWHQRPYQEKRE